MPASLLTAHIGHLEKDREGRQWEVRCAKKTKQKARSELYFDTFIMFVLLEVSFCGACCNVEVFPRSCAQIHPEACCQAPGPGHPKETQHSHGPQRGWDTRDIVHSSWWKKKKKGGFKNGLPGFILSSWVLLYTLRHTSAAQTGKYLGRTAKTASVTLRIRARLKKNNRFTAFVNYNAIHIASGHRNSHLSSSKHYCQLTFNRRPPFTR